MPALASAQWSRYVRPRERNLLHPADIMHVLCSMRQAIGLSTAWILLDTDQVSAGNHMRCIQLCLAAHLCSRQLFLLHHQHEQHKHAVLH